MVAMVGAIAGSLGNLLYPYFMREKGWTTPDHRRVQRYDLILGIIVLIVLDLSIWVVGAEILHPRNIQVVDLESLSPAPGRNHGRPGLLPLLSGRLRGPVQFHGGKRHRLCPAHRRRLHSASARGGGRPAAGDYKRHPSFRLAIYWVVLSP